MSSKEGLVAGTRKGHQRTGILQGTDVEVHSPHVITDQITVACMNEGGTARLVLASIDEVVHMSNRNPNSQIVRVCVDGFHEEGISRVQALLQAGSGILRSSRVQAWKDTYVRALSCQLQEPPWTHHPLTQLLF